MNNLKDIFPLSYAKSKRLKELAMKRGDTVLFQVVPTLGYWNIGILLAEIPDGYLVCSAVSDHNGIKDYTSNVCIAKCVELPDDFTTYDANLKDLVKED